MGGVGGMERGRAFFPFLGVPPLLILDLVWAWKIRCRARGRPKTSASPCVKVKGVSGPRDSALLGDRATLCPGPLSGIQRALCTRISHIFSGRPRYVQPWPLGPLSWPQQVMGSMGQTPQGLPQPPLCCGDSLGLSCFSSRPAFVDVWSAFVCPHSVQRKVLLKARLLCSHRLTHVILTQGLCLVYLADVLPEQMGKGNDSLSHFCLHCTLAHPSFSHPLSLGGHVCIDCPAAESLGGG